jgi:hypothetical protein
VGLQEAAVRLYRRALQRLAFRARFQPRRDLSAKNLRVRVQDQLSENLLGKRGARLGIGGNHDIVVTEGKIVPAGGIHQRVFQLAGFDRPGDSKRHVHVDGIS